MRVLSAEDGLRGSGALGSFHDDFRYREAAEGFEGRPEWAVVVAAGLIPRFGIPRPALEGE